MRKLGTPNTSSSTPMPGRLPYSPRRRSLVALSRSNRSRSTSSFSARGASTESSKSAKRDGIRRQVSNFRSVVSLGITAKSQASAAGVEQLAHGLHGQQAAGEHVGKRGAAVENGVGVGQVDPFV